MAPKPTAKKFHKAKSTPKHETVAKETQKLLTAMKIRRPAKSFYQGVPVQQLQWWQLQQQQLHEQHQLMLLQEFSLDEEDYEEDDYDGDDEELTLSGIDRVLRDQCVQINF